MSLQHKKQAPGASRRAVGTTPIDIRQWVRGLPSILAAAGFLLGVLLLTAADAAEKGASPAAPPAQQPIEIVSDQLTTDNKERYAEFTGNVEVTSEDFVLTSDSLRIYYEGDPFAGTAAGGGGQSLKKMVAQGNVHIRAEEYTAQSERVEYDMQTRIIELTGENSTVTKGNNTLIGKVIRLYRSDGRIEVEGSGSRRVKAIIVPDEKQRESLKMKQKETGSKSPKN
jgi:lipopolysaccharide export system protein LptA